jgi:membrane protease YdiL (CAAX protease family)
MANMTKNQKIWLGVFLAMFLVPEILWSPVSNIIFGLIKDMPYRNNFLIQTDNRSLLATVIFLQFLSLLGIDLILWSKKNYKSIKEGRVILGFSFILSTVVLLVLYVLIVATNISF